MPSVSKGKDGSVSVSMTCPMKGCGHRVVVTWKPPPPAQFSKVEKDGSLTKIGAVVPATPMTELNKVLLAGLAAHTREMHT